MSSADPSVKTLLERSDESLASLSAGYLQDRLEKDCSTRRGNPPLTATVGAALGMLTTIPVALIYKQFKDNHYKPADILNNIHVDSTTTPQEYIFTQLTNENGITSTVGYRMIDGSLGQKYKVDGDITYRLLSPEQTQQAIAEHIASLTAASDQFAHIADTYSNPELTLIHNTDITIESPTIQRTDHFKPSDYPLIYTVFNSNPDLSTQELIEKNPIQNTKHITNVEEIQTVLQGEIAEHQQALSTVTPAWPQDTKDSLPNYHPNTVLTAGICLTLLGALIGGKIDALSRAAVKRDLKKIQKRIQSYLKDAEKTKS